MDKEVLNESLLIASANGEVQQVQSLINQGSDVNYVGVLEHSLGFGLTPLMLAIKYNYPDVVKVLVENNADVNYKTPFLYVSEYGTPEILQILMENGADTTVTNNYGSNALQIANYQNTKFLLDIGFKDIKDYDGNTALDSLNAFLREFRREISRTEFNTYIKLKKILKSYTAKRPLEPLLMSLYKTNPKEYKGLPKDLLRRTGEFLHQFSKRVQRKSQKRKSQKKSRKRINKRKSKKKFVKILK